MSLASLVKFIQRYFILFYAVLKAINFIPDRLLLIHKNTTDYCILIFLCWNFTEFISCNSLVVVFIFYLYHVIHKWRQFCLFLIWIISISFSCLLLCPGLLVLCWIKVVRVSILVLLLILQEMLSTFYYYVVSCGLVINSLYYVEAYSLPT